MCIVLSTLLNLLSLLLYSFVDASSLLLMCVRVPGTRDLLNLDGKLFWVTGRLSVFMVHVVLCLPLIPGIGGFLLICMVFASGYLFP